jgi:hypothetical protein
VTVARANQAPTLVNPGAQTSLERSTVALPLQASDPDGDTLTFSATGLPPGLTIDGATGVIAGSLGYQAAGSYEVTVTVGDAAATTTAGFAWTVTNVPCNPIANPDTATTLENTPVDIPATDNDISPAGCGTPSVDVSAVSTPANGSVYYDPKFRVFTYTPAPNFTGIDTFTYTLTNADGGSATATVTVTVTAPVNRPPVIDRIADRAGARGDLVLLRVRASDPDGDPRTFSATGLPSGLSISSSTGVIFGILRPASVGTHTVVVTVSDGLATATTTFVWTVVNQRTLSIDDVTMVEGNHGPRPAAFTVTLSPPSPRRVTVRYTTADGSARAGSDYVAASGTLVFGPGETTRPVTVVVNGDTTVEHDETFVVNLSNPAGALLVRARGVGTIEDDDRLNRP